MESRMLISIVCPVYNEEVCVPLFYKRLKAAIEPLRPRYDFEILFTNNCSTDRTLEVIHDLRENDPSVQVVTLSRNFGYQASVLCGLRHASGNAIVVIDVDCEDPPELIPHFVLEWEKGYEVVYGKRERRPEFYGIQLMRKLFYRLNRSIADSEIILDMAEFSLIAAHVRDVIVDNHSTFPFLRTDVAYAGFARKGILYERERRIHGKTHYNLIGMTQFAIGGIISSSTFVLRLAAYAIPLLLLANLGLLAADLFAGYERAFHVLVALDLMYLAFFISVLCVYAARIYKDGVDRPVFIVDWRKSVLNRAQPKAERGLPARVWTTNKFGQSLPRPLSVPAAPDYNCSGHPAEPAPGDPPSNPG